MKRHIWRFPVVAGIIMLVVIGSALFIVLRQRPVAATKTIEPRLVQEFDGAQKSGVRYREPRGISISPTGHLVIADFRNYRIQEMLVSGEVVDEWGAQGNGPGQFVDPACAAMDAQGNLYVADTWNQRIQKRTADGQWLPNWAQYNGFSAPRGIAIDAQNRVYVANTSRHNIVVFDAQGQNVAIWGQQGSGPQDFFIPIGITVGPDGNIYVADTGNKRIKIIAPDGKTVSVISVAEWGFEQFHEAYIAVGQQQEIYVTLPLKNLIRVYQPQNKTFLQFGNMPELQTPTGIAVASDGSIYISDTSHHRIVKYAPIPSALLAVAPPSSVNGLNRSYSIILATLCALSLILNVILWVKWRGVRFRPLGGRGHYKRRSSLRSLRDRLHFHPILSISMYVSAVILLIAAVILYRGLQPLWGSVCFLLSVLVLILWLVPEDAAQADLLEKRDAAFSRKQFWLVLVGIVVVAWFLRSYNIEQIPWGINNDVAGEGSYARRVLDGIEPFAIFTTEDWGKETLFHYLIALSFKLFGVSRFTLYLPSIVAGVATTLAAFLLWRKLFGDRLAALSAFIYAAMAWSLTFSRMGARCSLVPLSVAFACYFYFQAVDAERARPKLLYFLACGLALGIGLHTYASFKVIPLMMIVLTLYSWVTTPRFLRSNWWGFIAVFIVALIVFAPLLEYASRHPEVFMGRVGFLFIGNQIAKAGSLQPLWDNLAANLLIFLYKAKVGNFFHNDLPIISRLLGFFAALGFAYHLRYILRRGSFCAMLAFFFGMLPAFLSAPDAARSLVTTVPVALFAATGVYSIAGFFTPLKAKRIFLVLTIVFCVGIMIAEGYFYFVTLGNSAGAQYGYARKHTLIGYKGLELSKTHHVYISQGHFIDTPEFICYGLPDVLGITEGNVVHYVPAEKLLANLRRILQLPVTDHKGIAFVFEQTPENLPLFEEVQRRYPQGTRQDYTDERYGKAVIFYTYVVPKEAVHIQ